MKLKILDDIHSILDKNPRITKIDSSVNILYYLTFDSIFRPYPDFREVLNLDEPFVYGYFGDNITIITHCDNWVDNKISFYENDILVYKMVFDDIEELYTSSYKTIEEVSLVDICSGLWERDKESGHPEKYWETLRIRFKNSNILREELYKLISDIIISYPNLIKISSDKFHPILNGGIDVFLYYRYEYKNDKTIPKIYSNYKTMLNNDNISLDYENKGGYLEFFIKNRKKPILKIGEDELFTNIVRSRRLRMILAD